MTNSLNSSPAHLSGTFAARTFLRSDPKAAKEPASPSHLVLRQGITETTFWHRDSFKINPTYNPDGLINCLRQPGLPLKRLQKSMRVNINSLIKPCGTRTVPSA
jgi:hypothetical protein